MEITYKKDYVGEGALCYNVYFNEELVDEAMGIYFDNNLNKYCVWIAYFLKTKIGLMKTDFLILKKEWKHILFSLISTI